MIALGSGTTPDRLLAQPAAGPSASKAIPPVSPRAMPPGGPSAAAQPLAGDAQGLWHAEVAALDDAAFLAHWGGARPVQVDVVVDEAECTPERLAGVMAGEFSFNGERHALPDPIDWLHNPSADIEWHILLHKGYYLAGLGREHLRLRARARDGRAAQQDRSEAAQEAERIARRWVVMLDGWMREVPEGFIAADVTGRRVQNWIYSLRGFLAPGLAPSAAIEPAFLRRLFASLHAQVEHLCAHLTPKRNHRTLELYAIFLAGVAFPEFRRAAHWRRFAMAETLANLQADLGADGVHCELSTDYHCLALRNWLHVRRLATRHGVPVPAAMDAALARALRFAMAVHQPDGGMPSFSDGDARGYRALLAEGAALYGDAGLRWVATGGAAGSPPGPRLMVFADSGYCTWRSSWGQGPADFARAQHLVFDCGPLGEGNHGHFDCLSFTLFADGRPQLVDPGRFTYSEAPDADGVNWRVHFRSTAAHSTVCVDGRPQTRYEPKPIKGPSRHAAGAVRHRIAGPAPEARLLEAIDEPGFTLLWGRADGGAMPVRHDRLLLGLPAGDGQTLWWVADALGPQPASDASSSAVDAQPREWAQHFQLPAEAEGRTALRCQAGAPGQADLWCCEAPGLTLVQPAAGLPADPSASGPATADDPVCVQGWVSTHYGKRDAAPKWRSVRHGVQAAFHTLLVPKGVAADAQPQAAPPLSPGVGDMHGDDAADGPVVASIEGRAVRLRVGWAAGPQGRRARWMRITVALPAAADGQARRLVHSGLFAAADDGAVDTRLAAGAWHWAMPGAAEAAAPEAPWALQGRWLLHSSRQRLAPQGGWLATASELRLAAGAQAECDGRPLQGRVPASADRIGGPR